MESHVFPEILRDLDYKDLPIILHGIVPSTHVDDLWSLGFILYHRLFGDQRRGGDVRITVVPLDAQLLDALRRHGIFPPLLS